MRNTSTEGTISTGFAGIDAAGGALQRGRLHVLLAPYVAGSTTLAVGIAMNVASRQHPAGVVYFSLSEPHNQISARLLSIESGVPIGAIREGQLTGRALHRVEAAASAIAKKPLNVDDAPVLPLRALRAKTTEVAARMVCTTGLELGLVVIDFVDLMDRPGRISHWRAELLCSALRAIARKHRVAVLALGLLRRQRRPDSRARLTQAWRRALHPEDNVMVLHRSRLPSACNEAHVSIHAGARACRVRRAELVFDADAVRFRDGCR